MSESKGSFKTILALIGVCTLLFSFAVLPASAEGPLGIPPTQNVSPNFSDIFLDGDAHVKGVIKSDRKGDPGIIESEVLPQPGQFTLRPGDNTVNGPQKKSISEFPSIDGLVILKSILSSSFPTAINGLFAVNGDIWAKKLYAFDDVFVSGKVSADDLVSNGELAAKTINSIWSKSGYEDDVPVNVTDKDGIQAKRFSLTPSTYIDLALGGNGFHFKTTAITSIFDTSLIITNPYALFTNQIGPSVNGATISIDSGIDVDDKIHITSDGNKDEGTLVITTNPAIKTFDAEGSSHAIEIYAKNIANKWTSIGLNELESHGGILQLNPESEEMVAVGSVKHPADLYVTDELYSKYLNADINSVTAKKHLSAPSLGQFYQKSSPSQSFKSKSQEANKQVYTYCASGEAVTGCNYSASSNSRPTSIYKVSKTFDWVTKQTFNPPLQGCYANFKNFSSSGGHTVDLRAMCFDPDYKP